MYKGVLIFAFCFFRAFSVQAQNQDDSSFSDRVFFGGNFSVNFFNGIFVDVSPIVGYRVTDRFSAGLGITYQYLKTEQQGVDLSTSIYGGRTFGRYNFYRNFFIHTEYEAINLEVLAFDENSEPFSRREWVPGAFAGGGLTQPLGRRASISFYVLYNFLHDDRRSPYNSPVVVRAGINL
ncbi:hypothetical protein AB9P05_12500 [Roseivirga sp. BDSF3-8]|uniref:hypothetical protein n=1 Tax=Roseivirga sp. BDSF3-8 TaxID=3241598 RepID=UPI003531D5AA